MALALKGVMICQEMCGSGLQVNMIKVDMSCAAARGSTIVLTAVAPAAATTTRRTGTSVRVFVAPGHFKLFPFTLLLFFARVTGSEEGKGNRERFLILPPACAERSRGKAAGSFLKKFDSKDILSLRDRRNAIPHRRSEINITRINRRATTHFPVP